MSKVIQYKLLHYPTTEDGLTWVQTPNNITNLLDSQTEEGIEVKADSFKIILKNPYDSKTGDYPYSNIFHLNDKLDFFVWEGIPEPEEYENKYLFSGLISQIDYTATNNKRFYSINGTNLTISLLKNILPAKYLYDSTYNTSSKIIQNMINIMNAYSKRKLIWHPDNSVSTKKINWTTDYKPVYKQIADLSTIENTGFENTAIYYVRAITIENGVATETTTNTIKDSSKSWAPNTYVNHYAIINNHEFKIKSNTSDTLTIENLENITIPLTKYEITGNYFYWKEKDTTTITNTIEEGNELLSLKISKGQWDTINAVIINAGRDPNGNAIYTFYFDSEGFASAGGKWEYVAIPKMADEMLKFEQEQNPSDWDLKINNRFPKDDNFPYTTAFVASFDDNEAPVFVEGQKVTCANKTEFNSAMRKEIKYRAKAYGVALIYFYGKSRYKAKVTLKGTLNFTPGDLIKVKSHSYGWIESQIPKNDTTQLLRIKNITHALGTSGWVTDLELEQDFELAAKIIR